MNRIPKPPRRNPFRYGTQFAQQFETLLRAYECKHRDLFYDGRRRIGSSLATAFWRGYDNVPAIFIDRKTFGWPAYRAGQAQRLIDDERGIYVAA